jgi:hypothetical protein
VLGNKDDITPCFRRTRRMVETKKAIPVQKNILDMVREKNLKNNLKFKTNKINTDDCVLIDENTENLPIANIFNQSINQINIKSQEDRYFLRNILNSQPTPKKDETHHKIFVEDSINGNLTTIIPNTQQQSQTNKPLIKELKRTNHDRIEMNNSSINIDDTVYEQKNKKFKYNDYEIIRIDETTSNHGHSKTNTTSKDEFLLPTQMSQLNETYVINEKDTQGAGISKNKQTSTPKKTHTKCKINNLLDVSIIVNSKLNKILTEQKTNNQVIINDTEMHETNVSSQLIKQTVSTQIVNETKFSSQNMSKMLMGRDLCLNPSNKSRLESARIIKIPLESPLVLKKIVNKEKNINTSFDLSNKIKKFKKIRLKKPENHSLSSSDDNDSFRIQKNNNEKPVKTPLNDSFKFNMSSSLTSEVDDDIPLSVIHSKHKKKNQLHRFKLKIPHSNYENDKSISLKKTNIESSVPTHNISESKQIIELKSIKKKPFIISSDDDEMFTKIKDSSVNNTLNKNKHNESTSLKKTNTNRSVDKTISSDSKKLNNNQKNEFKKIKSILISSDDDDDFLIKQNIIEISTKKIDSSSTYRNNESVSLKKTNIESSILINGTVDCPVKDEKNLNKININMSISDISDDNISFKTNLNHKKTSTHVSLKNKNESKYKDLLIKTTLNNIEDKTIEKLNNNQKNEYKSIKDSINKSITISSDDDDEDQNKDKNNESIISLKKTNIESSIPFNNTVSSPSKSKKISDSKKKNESKSIKTKSFIISSDDDDKMSTKKINIESSILINGIVDCPVKSNNTQKNESKLIKNSKIQHLTSSCDDDNSLVKQKITEISTISSKNLKKANKESTEKASTHISLKTKYENSKESNHNIESIENNNCTFENVLDKEKLVNNKKSVKDPIIIKISSNKKQKNNDLKAMPPPPPCSKNNSSQGGLFYNGIFIPVVNSNKNENEAKIRIKLNNSSSNRTANSSNGSINTSRYDRFDLKKLISDSLNKSKT